MSVAIDVERRLRERTTALGLANTQAILSPHSTLSPRTLAAAGVPLPPVAGLDETALAEAPLPTATADLPHISVDLRAAEGDARGDSAGTADLKILRALGEGGMGRVLLARQRSLGREVAIKTLKSAPATPMLAAALLREARITGALEHPGIVPVHALGLDDAGSPLLVMKRIEGVSFRALLDDPSHPNWSAVASGRADRLEANLEILMRICQSLAFAHSRGVVHRDIKPDNIMVGGYGEVYLCDWGVAAQADEAAAPGGFLVGTPVYMAPEMALGDPIDARTDVYLLGATLHEVLTGSFRHDGGTITEVLRSAALSEPFAYDAAAPPELADLCNRATARDPALRPASAELFRRELSEHLRHRSAVALCDAALERVGALEAALDRAPPSAAPNDIAGAYRLATEARFGLAQSLREEPSLDAARRGLARALAALFDLELRQDHMDSAAAVLSEMTDPPADLVDRLSVARARAEDRRREDERMRAIVRDLDPSVSARSRYQGLALFVACVLVIAAGIIFGPGHDNLTVLDLAWIEGFTLVGVLAALFAVRKRMLKTLFNRRVAAILVFTNVFMFVHRLLAWRAGLDVPTVLGADVFILGGMATVGAFTLERRLAVAVAWMVVIRGVMEIYPQHSGQLFSAITIPSALLCIWVWRMPSVRGAAASDDQGSPR